MQYVLITMLEILSNVCKKNYQNEVNLLVRKNNSSAYHIQLLFNDREKLKNGGGDISWVSFILGSDDSDSFVVEAQCDTFLMGFNENYGLS